MRARFLSVYESGSPCPTNIDINSFNISVSDIDVISSCFSFSNIFVENTQLLGKFFSSKFSIQYASFKNAHERLYPASLTKVMTALVALQNASPDSVLTATDSVKITESGAQLCGLKAGDTMTLDQALHILLIYSANDAAMLIAENIGGSVDHFVEMMNEEAQRLGATNTSFANPHGLSDDNHYTSAYDLYLIFNEAIKYDSFNEIIHMTSYQTAYYDKDGKAKELTVNNTNRFLRGDFQAPENITVIGGKTGTTNAAGHCLILLSRDTSGAPYISVILNSSASDVLYPEMVQLLEQINK